MSVLAPFTICHLQRFQYDKQMYCLDPGPPFKETINLQHSNCQVKAREIEFCREK